MMLHYPAEDRVKSGQFPTAAVVGVVQNVTASAKNWADVRTLLSGLHLFLFKTKGWATADSGTDGVLKTAHHVATFSSSYRVLFSLYLDLWVMTESHLLGTKYWQQILTNRSNSQLCVLFANELTSTQIHMCEQNSMSRMSCAYGYP